MGRGSSISALKDVSPSVQRKEKRVPTRLRSTHVHANQTQRQFKDRLLAELQLAAEKQQVSFYEYGIRVTPQVVMLGQKIHWIGLTSERVSPADADNSEGKYLFFSTEPGVLAELAYTEISSGFKSAKLSVHPSEEWNEHCLCLFADRDKDTSIALEARWPQVKFRGWKSHEQSKSDHEQARRQAISLPAAA